ncbi:MAG: TMEM165/GDT1 family protein [Syntrophomonas sp.]
MRLSTQQARLFFTAFGLVLVSEMGDKTQITTLLLAGAKPTLVLWVGLGSAMALICASLLEVIIASQVLSRIFKPDTIHLLSALIFTLLGLLLVLGLIGNTEI